LYKLLIAICVALGVYAAPARAIDLDAEKDGLAQRYLRACQSYQQRSAGPLQGVYTDDAIQVLFPPRGTGRVTMGGAAIVESDERNFERMRRFGATAALTYKIVEREVQGDAVVDRGYFRLVGESPHGRLDEVGRVLIIQRKDADGRWRQNFHANAPATQAEYDAAEASLTFCTA
jgi:ketosteroid isomerase-like protein